MSAFAYDKLLALSKNIALMNSIHCLLDWDQETYMPKDAIELRSQQSEIMASLIHKQKTGKAFAKALSSLIAIETGEILPSDLSTPQIAALKQWRRDYLRNIKLPNAFVKQFAKTPTMPCSTSTNLT